MRRGRELARRRTMPSPASPSTPTFTSVRVQPESVEPISKPLEEDDEASELNEAEEVLGVILPLHKHAALPLDPGEDAFYQPPSAYCVAALTNAPDDNTNARQCAIWTPVPAPTPRFHERRG